MARQEEPKVWCPCGRAKIFTAPHMRKFNSVVDGKQVCVECKLESFYAKYSKTDKEN